ncbi:MAG TPA: hypothetical protein VK427_04725 [Kofleriaceae bacterium]|nr:hypothetical protein [Kofleriaceae bacterium]
MRRLAVLALALATSPAAADSLWTAELRAGYGVAIGGGQGTSTKRLSPVALDATISVAIHDQPRVFAYGGLAAETFDRSAVGATFGVRMHEPGTALRVAAGGTWLIAPYTLWGGVASAGLCTREDHGRRYCADAQLTAYFAGTDLAEGKTVLQAQLMLGFAFGG